MRIQVSREIRRDVTSRARPHGERTPCTAGVRCLVAPHTVTARTIVDRRPGVIGLSGRIDDLEQRIAMRTGIGFTPRSPLEWARTAR